jgi:hypothetical protein
MAAGFGDDDATQAPHAISGEDKEQQKNEPYQGRPSDCESFSTTLIAR